MQILCIHKITYLPVCKLRFVVNQHHNVFVFNKLTKITNKFDNCLLYSTMVNVQCSAVDTWSHSPLSHSTSENFFLNNSFLPFSPTPPNRRPPSVTNVILMLASAVVGGFENTFSTVVHLLTKRYKELIYTKSHTLLNRVVNNHSMKQKFTHMIHKVETNFLNISNVNVQGYQQHRTTPGELFRDR